MTQALHLAIAVLPVFVFLLLLVFLDSYKLIRFSAILRAVGYGGLAALACMVINRLAFGSFHQMGGVYAWTGGPLVEELIKAGYLIYLIRRGKAGFMVDAAIFGFAIGAGFAAVENIHEVQTNPDSNLFLWVLRGFATATMHGGTTAIVGIFARRRSLEPTGSGWAEFLPGLAAAVAIHCIYNLPLLSPLAKTTISLIGVPTLIALSLMRSERMVYQWLGKGLDNEMQLLQMVKSGQLSKSSAGDYLRSLRHSFPPEVVVDMLGYLRLRLELTIRAKGDLLKREAGFEVSSDPEIRKRLEELKILEKSIGPTGRLAIAPLFPDRGKELWQLYMLGYK